MYLASWVTFNILSIVGWVQGQALQVLMHRHCKLQDDYLNHLESHTEFLRVLNEGSASMIESEPEIFEN